MAKKILFAVFDSSADVLTAPMMFRSEQEAVRSFQDGMKKNEHWNQYPGDFSLFQIAYYDDETGIVTQTQDLPKKICSGTHFVEEKQKTASVTSLNPEHSPIPNPLVPSIRPSLKDSL